MNKNKLKTLSLSVVLSSILFSVLCFSYHPDISITAMPLALLFTAAVYICGYNNLFRKNDLRFLSVFRTLLQYKPYVLLVAFVLRRAGIRETSFALDLICVILWCVCGVLDLWILKYLNPNRTHLIDENWKKYTESHSLSKTKGLKRTVLEALSWVDALVQAVFMVLLLNIFIVQLYEIPSESMVPEFLVKDRVVVLKTASGPRFPLSEVGIPYLKKYKRGEIVVFRNPHYSDDRKSEVKNFLSQLVYMLTLTKVNLNVDEHGNPKADPLVKRITGVPGEQLMMQDGILYSRTAKNPEWKVVEKDSLYAEWNLNDVKSSVKKGIHDFPLSSYDYEKMIECEEERRNLDLNLVEAELKGLSHQFTQAFNICAQGKSEDNLDTFFNQNNLFEYALFAQHQYATQKLITSKDGPAWFNKFLTDWISNKNIDFDGNKYEEAAFRFNLMLKRTAAKIIVRDAQLFANGYSIDQLNSDSKIIDLLKEAEVLNSYCMLQDRRNMPAFPASDKNGNPSYIPENCYFMMGDNRFNSLDMRHSYSEWLAPVTAYDKYSITYLTNMKPQYVNRSRILGSTCYRFWPMRRHGVPGRTGK